ncbi:MAG: sugar transferase [Ornithinimicrobium sp.]
MTATVEPVSAPTPHATLTAALARSVPASHFTLPERDSRSVSAHPTKRHQARRYLQGYLRTLFLLDLLCISVAVAAAQVGRFGWSSTERVVAQSASTLTYSTVSLLLIVAWVTMLRLQDAYDGRLSGHGVQEYRAMFTASVWLFSLLAIVSFAFRLDFARGYVVIAFPLGTALLLGGRWCARRWLVRQRECGRLSDRVLLVGDRADLSPLITALHRTPSAGYNVLGACLDDAPGVRIGGVPVVGRSSDVVVRAMEMDVDVVAVSSSAGLGSEGLRRLGWALEGTDIDLVVAPGIMDVAGPRVMTRPVQGLPLLHVEAPTFGGPQLVFKRAVDRIAAALGLIVLAPLLAGIALMIFLDDRGPVFFEQERTGRDGRPFRLVKFRSMAVDAEARLAQLMAGNQGAGPLFKLKDDPRVTRIGSFIRKYSLDELPQLINVVRGDMSLVGPRPPLPREVEEYEDSTHRRLLVKPGMTGLWQISGRSDLSWDEAVRLDLYYVENWSPLLDLMILWRTVQVVANPEKSGAY